MKKKIALSMLFASVASAGTMGPLAVYPNLSFVSVEGGYTWNRAKGINASFFDENDDLITIFSNQKKKGGTARVAYGSLRPLNDLFFLSGEIGWGYYGKNVYRFSAVDTTIDAITVDLDGADFNNTLWGFDILAGIAYRAPRYDIFFKAGGLIQNSQVKLRTEELDISEDIFPSNFTFRQNSTQVLPVIKLGASYYWWENLSLFGAWTYAFGSTPKVYLREGLDTPAFGDVNLRNPTMNVVTGGLAFWFA